MERWLIFIGVGLLLVAMGLTAIPMRVQPAGGVAFLAGIILITVGVIDALID